MKYPSLTFEQPDRKTFRCLDLAFEAMKKGGNAPCVLNAANEVAVQLFLHDKISFASIPDHVEKIMAKVDYIAKPTLEDYVESDRLSRIS